ncbi:hypothetical protein [Tissierella sp.]|uniref:hypothetical protein n=1 Tax=Tissierella sp. TaxID=41274 RepID=UPI0028AAAFD6|nr:hypothetical protein [Tissierella sp.]
MCKFLRRTQFRIWAYSRLKEYNKYRVLHIENASKLEKEYIKVLGDMEMKLLE